MDQVVYTVIKTLVLPPGLQVAIGICGLMLYPRWRRSGLLLIAAAPLSLWLLSMSATAYWLARPLESVPPLAASALAGIKADAIVALGGGAYENGPENAGADDVSRLTLERLRYAARLHRASGIELAVSGGAPGRLRTPEGILMSRALQADFGVPVRWVEADSDNTAENALFSRQKFPFKRIILVTHALHMPRALRAFERAGFEVIPAPMGFFARGEGAFEPDDFLPTMSALSASEYAIYERFGALWYRWNYE